MSTTITSLLNSLHTHLQSQTQLLPTLHAQLGLPPTALTDELNNLQQQLTQCIESQIDLRRKQVDEWMEQCADMEDQCIRYSKALGGHVKATSGSVGEIRKEQVLPRRFEIISEYQEKLRQVRMIVLRPSLAMSHIKNCGLCTYAYMWRIAALPHQTRTTSDTDWPTEYTIIYPWLRLLSPRHFGSDTRSRRGRV